MNYHSTEAPSRELTYKVGDIPEYAARLQDLASIIYAQERANQQRPTPLPGGMEGNPTNPDEIVIFPIGEGEARPGGKGDGGDEIKIDKDITVLKSIADAWGNDSEVYGWHFGSNVEEDEKNPNNYYVALLKNESGDVTAFVADTYEANNALYVWRADASAALTHIEALSGSKNEVRDWAINGRSVRHRGDMESRINDLLHMDADKYIAMRERERSRNARRRLGSTATG